MTIDSPFEGKIVILSYTECDIDSEDTACLVFNVEQERLVPLLGVMNLPDGLFWHRRDYDQYAVALAIIRGTGCTEVFALYYTIPEKPFFGERLGFTALSEGLNDQDEIEEWFELGDFTYNWEMIRLLEECQIKVRYIDPETLLVIEEKN
jgi:hypothetical protein